jgi:hypothetical protein
VLHLRLPRPDERPHVEHLAQEPGVQLNLTRRLTRRQTELLADPIDVVPDRADRALVAA